MNIVSVRKQDQILMSLVHYFVTKENYSPIFVHGVKDEIWLERLDGPYRVIRINNNHIFNEEQFRFDQFKIKDILRQIKKKTMSLSVNALNINLNADDDVDDSNGLKNIDNIKVKSLNDIENNPNFIEIFPKIKDGLVEDDNGIEMIFNITKDINEKTNRDNKKFEKIFSSKKLYVTKAIMAICIFIYLLTYIVGNGASDAMTLIHMGANAKELLINGEIWRLVTYTFLHGNILHLICNMYSLYIVGNQVEAKFGKERFIIIYLLSAIGGGFLSAAFNPGTISVGASGAIFGLLGAYLYFGLHFRLLLKDAIKYQIIPIIIINLFIGYMIPGIDNFCHIGGLIAGYLAAKAVGIPESTSKKEYINGTALLIIYILFLCYLVFFR